MESRRAGLVSVILICFTYTGDGKGPLPVHALIILDQYVNGAARGE